VEICGKNLVKNKSKFLNEWSKACRLPVNGLKGPENRRKFTGFIKLNRLRPMLFLLYA